LHADDFTAEVRVEGEGRRRKTKQRRRHRNRAGEVVAGNFKYSERGLVKRRY